MTNYMYFITNKTEIARKLHYMLIIALTISVYNKELFLSWSEIKTWLIDLQFDIWYCVSNCNNIRAIHKGYLQNCNVLLPHIILLTHITSMLISYFRLTSVYIHLTFRLKGNKVSALFFTIRLLPYSNYFVRARL